MSTIPVRRYLLLTVTALLTVAACVCPGARADHPSVPTHAPVVVSGDVDEPRNWAFEELRDLPGRTETVTFQTHAGPRTHTYTGCLLDSVLAAAKPHGRADQTNPLLPVAVVVTGADGYTATLSWAETAPTVSPKPAMLAFSEDTRVLDRPRLVVPADLVGARYVTDVVALRVVNLAA